MPEVKDLQTSIDAQPYNNGVPRSANETTPADETDLFYIEEIDVVPVESMQTMRT